MNILFVGIGPHTRRIQLPYCIRNAKSLSINQLVTLDLEENINAVSSEIAKYKVPIVQYYTNKYIDKVLLNRIIKKHKISHVVLGTDPEHHTKYLAYFISKDLHVLMDKPISAVVDSSIKKSASHKIFKEFTVLTDLYKQHPLSSVCILSQRRYHPGYDLISKDLKDNYNSTNLVPHYIYLLHSDGQFRFLKEIDDISYHGFNRGYGKISHSGYHFIDTLYVYLKHFLALGEINEYAVRCEKLNPNDYSLQVKSRSVDKIFSSKATPYIAKSDGEIDAYVTIQFLKNGQLVTTARIDMLHSGFSDRLSFESNHKNLYKGNGRIRHEKQIVLQGPVYAAYIDSLQSKQINLSSNETDLSQIGGEHHFDIIRFNHSSSGKEVINKTSIADIMNVSDIGYSRGHQEEARYYCLDDFFATTIAGSHSKISDLTDHYFSALMMSKIYESLASKKTVIGRFDSSTLGIKL